MSQATHMTLNQIKNLLPQAQWVNGLPSDQEVQRLISDSRQSFPGIYSLHYGVKNMMRMIF